MAIETLQATEIHTVFRAPLPAYLEGARPGGYDGVELSS